MGIFSKLKPIKFSRNVFLCVGNGSAVIPLPVPTATGFEPFNLGSRVAHSATFTGLFLNIQTNKFSRNVCLCVGNGSAFSSLPVPTATRFKPSNFGSRVASYATCTGIFKNIKTNKFSRSV